MYKYSQALSFSHHKSPDMSSLILLPTHGCSRSNAGGLELSFSCCSAHHCLRAFSCIWLSLKDSLVMGWYEAGSSSPWSLRMLALILSLKFRWVLHQHNIAHEQDIRAYDNT